MILDFKTSDSSSCATAIVKDTPLETVTCRIFEAWGGKVLEATIVDGSTGTLQKRFLGVSTTQARAELQANYWAKVRGKLEDSCNGTALFWELTDSGWRATSGDVEYRITAYRWQFHLRKYRGGEMLLMPHEDRYSDGSYVRRRDVRELMRFADLDATANQKRQSQCRP